ncbi:hypothetical protein C2G38_2176082 [Gigaspora rosea]|uniref:Uncharacterized protein n=1 Tax=Gigaspora rosea TaxID=44941 RepID=A0A397VIG5_9GLOM|nr:hypothetical protein C2G38_2176082 [Gigaspora rosea]
MNWQKAKIRGFKIDNASIWDTGIAASVEPSGSYLNRQPKVASIASCTFINVQISDVLYKFKMGLDLPFIELLKLKYTKEPECFIMDEGLMRVWCLREIVKISLPSSRLTV